MMIVGNSWCVWREGIAARVLCVGGGGGGWIRVE